MKVLLDTNILARLAQPTHHQHQIANAAVECIRIRGDDPCIVPQVLYEFWVVCTRPEAQNGLGMSIRAAETEMTDSMRLFSLFRDERAIFQKWAQLVVAHEVRGKTAHDARLVAAMHRHGLTHILTFNAADFVRFPVTVLTPDDVLTGPPPASA